MDDIGGMEGSGAVASCCQEPIAATFSVGVAEQGDIVVGQITELCLLYEDVGDLGEVGPELDGNEREKEPEYGNLQKDIPQDKRSCRQPALTRCDLIRLGH
jgi:hypothetical protein